VVAGGFLVPGNTDGLIYLYDTSDPPSPKRSDNPVAALKKGYFYHQTAWVDINGDGRLDLLAARATVPTLPWKKKAADLVWLEQPASGAMGGSWAEHLIVSDGPDVAFALVQWGSGPFQIVSTQFFTAQALSLWWCEGASWAACSDGGSGAVKSRVIDGSVGAFFNVQLADLNGDGKAELLATNNVADGKGKVLAYEVPDDWKAGDFASHVLQDGYKPKGSTLLPGKGAPGVARTLPTLVNKKPLILVSGDDAGTVYLLSAASAAAGDWSYDAELVAEGSATVGSPAFGDANGDGVPELWVPNYSDNKMLVFALNASAA
jgi:hypothetical protein